MNCPFCTATSEFIIHQNKIIFDFVLTSVVTTKLKYKTFHFLSIYITVSCMQHAAWENDFILLMMPTISRKCF